MDPQSVSYKTLKNSGYGMLGYVVPILFFIVVTPVVIHRLGIVDYGVFVLVNTIVAFLSLLDLGFTVSLIKFVSEYFAKGETQSLNKILNVGHSLYLLMGAVGLVVFFAIGKFFLPVFNISTGSIPHIEIVFLIAGLIFFVNGLMAVYQAVPNALQRFDIITKLTIVQLFFTQGGILAVVTMGYKLKAIFLVNLVCIVGILIAYRIYCRKI
ncbi:MAG TPA: oligosaccharide flippase family protein, partial [Candidatus Limnocylindria bacterium]|nr:oligosaccharide flippase family protein [Candidatus Limnocylindria bacterium]